MNVAELRVDEELILRMSGAGPRYTSYPTVPEWREFGDADARAALVRASAKVDEPLCVYVHLPFCARMCLFCGCTVEITRRQGKVDSYLAAIEKEVAMTCELLGSRRKVAQIYNHCEVLECVPHQVTMNGRLGTVNYEDVVDLISASS